MEGMENQEIQNEEIVETPEEIVETPEGQKQETETNDTEFNPEDLEFDDIEDEEQNEKFHGYNLEKFSDRLDLENEEAVEIINSKLSQFKELGLSQEQSEKVLEMLIEEHSADEDEAVTPEKVKEELKKSLSFEEKKNYKAVGSYLKQHIAGDAVLEKTFQEAMSNPIVYKLVHKLYKGNLGGKNIEVGTKSRETREVQNISSDKAIADFNSFLKTPSAKGNIKQYAQELMSKMNTEEKNKFKAVIGSIAD